MSPILHPEVTCNFKTDWAKRSLQIHGGNSLKSSIRLKRVWQETIHKSKLIKNYHCTYCWICSCRMLQPKYMLFSLILLLLLFGESGLMQTRKGSWPVWWIGFWQSHIGIFFFKNISESHFSFFFRVPPCLKKYLLLGRQFTHSMHLLSITIFSTYLWNAEPLLLWTSSIIQPDKKKAAEGKFYMALHKPM